jgi:hypothetical protein
VELILHLILVIQQQVEEVEDLQVLYQELMVDLQVEDLQEEFLWSRRNCNTGNPTTRKFWIYAGAGHFTSPGNERRRRRWSRRSR